MLNLSDLDTLIADSLRKFIVSKLRLIGDMVRNSVCTATFNCAVVNTISVSWIFTGLSLVIRVIGLGE